jgi:rhodanese-related sulfurtransferase
LTQAGLRNVFALRGGMEAWRAAGMPLVAREEPPVAQI